MNYLLSKVKGNNFIGIAEIEPTRCLALPGPEFLAGFLR